MTTLRDYLYDAPKDLKDVIEIVRLICNIRKDDIDAFRNLPNQYMAGRRVAKIPTNSADVTASDLIGDLNYDASFLYILIDNAGTAEWRRATLASF